MIKKFYLIFIISLISISPGEANEIKNDEYFNKMIPVFEEKCEEKSNSEFLHCLAEYTPKKCKQLVYGRDRLAWKQCVNSCGDANLYSKTLGECSK